MESCANFPNFEQQYEKGLFLFGTENFHSLKAKVRSWNKQRLKQTRAARAQSVSDDRAMLCVMIIVKNEALNILEWADHYFWQGAAHLVVIDNGCTDETIRLLRSHPRSSDITFFHLPRQHRQAEHYRHAFKSAKIRSRFKWLIIADGDEFWFSPLGRSLPEVLISYENQDLVYCNWTNFGSSGKVDHPASLRKELVQCAPTFAPHEFTKWAVKTDAIKRLSQIRVHKVSGCRSTHTISESQQLQINHYVTQSLRFWKEVKMKRGDVIDPANDAARNMGMFDALEAGFTSVDETLATKVRSL